MTLTPSLAKLIVIPLPRRLGNSAGRVADFLAVTRRFYAATSLIRTEQFASGLPALTIRRPARCCSGMSGTRWILTISIPIFAVTPAW